MRKLFLSFAMLQAMAGVAADVADNDTTIVENAKRVVIVTNDSLQKVHIYGREGDPDYHYENTLQVVDSNYTATTVINRRGLELKFPLGERDSCSESGHGQLTTHMAAGYNAALNANPNPGFATMHSLEISWTVVQFDFFLNKKKRMWVSTGLGLDWRNYRADEDFLLRKEESGAIVSEHYPDGVTPKFSRIKVFSLQVPLLLSYDFVKDGKLGLSLGVVTDFNTYASIKTRYRMDGGSFKQVTKSIGQRPVTMSLMGIVRNSWLGFYVKYCPQDILKDATGMRFKSLTFGIYL